MTFDDWWERVCTMDPQLRNSEAKVKISVTQLQRLCRIAYNTGNSEGVVAAHDLSTLGRMIDRLGHFAKGGGA